MTLQRRRISIISVVIMLLVVFGVYLAADRLWWVNVGPPIEAAYSGENVHVASVGNCDDWIEIKAVAGNPELVRWRCGLVLSRTSGIARRSDFPQFDDTPPGKSP